MPHAALPSAKRLSTLFGAYDDNLRHLEGLLSVRIRTQGHDLFVEGDPADTNTVARFVEHIGGLIADGHALSARDVKGRGFWG